MGLRQVFNLLKCKDNLWTFMQNVELYTLEAKVFDGPFAILSKSVLRLT